MHIRDAYIIETTQRRYRDLSPNIVAVGVHPTCAMEVGLEVAGGAFVYADLGLLDNMFTARRIVLITQAVPLPTTHRDHGAGLSLRRQRSELRTAQSGPLYQVP